MRRAELRPDVDGPGGAEIGGRNRFFQPTGSLRLVPAGASRPSRWTASGAGVVNPAGARIAHLCAGRPGGLPRPKREDAALEAAGGDLRGGGRRQPPAEPVVAERAGPRRKPPWGIKPLSLTGKALPPWLSRSGILRASSSRMRFWLLHERSRFRCAVRSRRSGSISSARVRTGSAGPASCRGHAHRGRRYQPGAPCYREAQSIRDTSGQLERR